MQFNKIEIDFDIYKLIELERNDFDEPPYVALRRLLKLPAPTIGATPETIIVPTSASGCEMAWSGEGITIPHGSFARMEYGRGSQIFEGQFLNGKLVVNGKSFNSLSAAATELAVTRNGKKTSLNGWLYWKVKLPHETEWKLISNMRK